MNINNPEIKFLYAHSSENKPKMAYSCDLSDMARQDNRLQKAKENTRIEDI